MNTRREESKLQSRRRRARSSAEAGKDAKDTQRIVPRGPSGHEGRLKKVDEEEARRGGAAKIDDPDLRGAPIDAPPAEEIEASMGKGPKQRRFGQPAEESAAPAPPQPGGDPPAPTVMKKPPPSDLEGRPPER